jgi:hypothetical protein
MVVHGAEVRVSWLTYKHGTATVYGVGEPLWLAACLSIFIQVKWALNALAGAFPFTCTCTACT